MAQQFPPNGGRGGHGGRGPSPGGRGAGRGIPPQQQPQPQPYNFAAGGSGRGGSRTGMGAWQPAQPTSSLQQAAAYSGPPPSQPPQNRPPPGGYASMGVGGMAYYNPYASGGNQAFVPRTDPNHHYQGQHTYAPAPHQQQATRGVVYYPPTVGPPVGTIPQVPMPQSQMPQPPAPREKKPLIITDKQGNVITFPTKEPVTSSLQTAAATVAKPVVPDAGAKMREAALERIKGQAGNKPKETEVAKVEVQGNKETESNVAKESIISDKLAEAENSATKTNVQADIDAAAKAKSESDDKARIAAEAKAKVEAEEKAKIEAEESAKVAEELAKAEAQEKATREAEALAKVDAAATSLSVAAAGTVADAKSQNDSLPPPKRIVITKEALLSFKNDPQCTVRPAGLPDMAVARSQASNKPVGGGGGGGAGGGGGGGGRNRGANRGGEQTGGGNWERGSAPPRRQSSQGERNERGGGGGGGNEGGGSWSRGQAPPRQQSQNQKGGRGGRGGRGGGHHQQLPLYDGPVTPLKKSENHWRPRKNTSALVVAEKQVKSLLNKMTKEKFDRLSEQMLQIPISSYEILTMMIDNVYDKAIDEPRFGDMYADLCVRLSQSVQGTEFVHIIESDEEPPTEDGTSAPAAGESSAHTVYRWSNDVSATDSEIVGPLPSADDCIAAAHDEEEHTPVERGDMELELVKVVIKRSIFIKIMKKKDTQEDEDDSFYAVYFPASEAEELGQSLSGIFLSQVECESDATKKNSFKRSLLNKCEEEFNKQDIYVDWKREKKEYEESKSSMTEAERREKADELNFRRIRIKKQMLGNVQFIGQLYKKNLLKEKIMRYCIGKLLLLEEIKEIKAKNPEYCDAGSTENIDLEDHEAICSLFGTIGATIDKPPAAEFMHVCFQKIRKLSADNALPSRSRFMYKDLIELKDNHWVPRRKEEKAKTIAEIRKDVELEERRQAEESARAGRGGGDFRNSGRGSGDTRSGSNRYLPTQSLRARQPKPATQTDDDGFTPVTGGKTGSVSRLPASKPVQPRMSPSAPSMTKSAYGALKDEKDTPSQSTREPLNQEKFERLIKSMRTDFMSDGGDVNELLLSLDEISGTPDYGVKLISKNMESLFECKEAERKAMNRIIIILCEKGKLSKDDIQNGLVDTIEFIDDIVVDSPRAYEYLGDLLGEMLRIKVIDINWVCDQLEKTKVSVPSTKGPVAVIRFALFSLKKSGGPDALKPAINDQRIVTLIGADEWKAIQSAL